MKGWRHFFRIMWSMNDKGYPFSEATKRIFCSKQAKTKIGKSLYKLNLRHKVIKYTCHRSICKTNYYYMVMYMSQKDWKQTISRIWLTKIDLDRGLDFQHLHRHLDRSCCNSCHQKVTNKKYEKIGLFVQSLSKAGLWTVNFVPFGLETSDRRKPAKCLSPRKEANKIINVFFPCFLVWPYNIHLINRARSVCIGESWPRSLVQTSLRLVTVYYHIVGTIPWFPSKALVSSAWSLKRGSSIKLLREWLTEINKLKPWKSP